MKRAVALMMLLLSACSGGDAPSVACHSTGGEMPGLQVGGLPWPSELSKLEQRLGLTGLPALKQEGSATDHHFNVSITIEGSKVVLPTNIGINGREVSGGRMETGFVSPIHTHDATGLVHIHSPEVRDFTLGQFFDVWGLAFSAERIGGFCAGEGKTLTVTVDGKPAPGDPRAVLLADGQRIAVTYA